MARLKKLCDAMLRCSVCSSKATVVMDGTAPEDFPSIGAAVAAGWTRSGPKANLWRCPKCSRGVK